MKVMFDSNIWQNVVCPDDYTSDPQYDALCKIHQLIEEGKIEAFLSETMFTLENIKKTDRKAKMGSMKPSIKTTVTEISGGAKMRITIGPNPDDSVSLDDNPHLKKYALEALKMGFHIVSLPRIGMLTNRDIESHIHHLSEEELEKAFAVGDEIEKRGAGIAQIQALISSNPGRSINDKIKNASEADAKKIARSIAEWADGDSVAISIALGCDYFCTRDEAHGAGIASILGSANLTWLENAYEFKAVKPEYLIAVC